MDATGELDRLRAALLSRPLPEGVCGTSDHDLNPDASPAPDRTLRPAGVLMPVQETDRGLRVLLTRRSSRLKHHPGQIAFPGGKQEPFDRDAIDAALREAEEEIGLARAQVELLGHLPGHETVTGFFMAPVVGLVRGPFRPVPEPGEVAEVFSVPLAHVTRVENFTVQWRRWRGHRRHYYVAPYGPYYIWGATARVLRGLADHLAP